jgi:hypothetical protein
VGYQQKHKLMILLVYTTQLCCHYCQTELQTHYTV